jgi:hypothetical protein
MVRAVSSDGKAELGAIEEKLQADDRQRADRQHDDVVEPQVEAAEVDRALRQQGRKRLGIGALRVEQPHAFAQHGAGHECDQERVERRRRAQWQDQIARDRHADERHCRRRDGDHDRKFERG